MESSCVPSVAALGDPEVAAEEHQEQREEERAAEAPDAVEPDAATEAGEPVVFGDSSRPALLQAAGIHRARALAITFDDLPETNWSVDNKALVAIGRLSQALLEGLPDSP